MYSVCKNKYRIFKPVEITRKEDRKEKNRGDEPNQAITHSMEMSQGNSGIAILHKQNVIYFFFSYTISENRKVKQILFGGWHQWEGGGHKERV
jgi:hypothetical protein